MSNLKTSGKNSKNGSSVSEPQTDPVKGLEEVVTTTHTPPPSGKEGRLLTSRKFLLCFSTLFFSFLLVAFDKDVRALEIIVPAVLAVYFGANVSQDYVFRRTQRSSYREEIDVPSRDLSDLRRRQ